MNPIDRSLIEAFFKENCILVLTTKCNNRCIICQDADLNDAYDISKSFSMLKNEVDDFIRRGAKEVTIYGGEPYLNRNMKRILKYIASHDVKCSISTNARVFSNKDIIKSIDGMSNVDVTTTLFSINAKNHDYITTIPGSFKQTIQGIKNLVKKGVWTRITIPLASKNVNDLSETVCSLYEIGIRSFKLSGLIDKGRMVDRHDLIPKFTDVRRNIRKMLILMEGKDTKISYEKLPYCVLSDLKGCFVYEGQHKKLILTKPRSKQKCFQCASRHECMGSM